MPEGQPYKTQRRTCAYAQCGKTFVARKAYGAAGPWPKYCGTACAREAKLAKDRNRARPYSRCHRCKRNKDLRWDSGRYCSALCYGAAAMMACGLSESDAERRVQAALDKDPSLASRTAVRVGRSVSGGMTRDDIEMLTENDMWASFTVKETALGGHLGPDEGRTSVRIPALVTDKDSWFESNPEWWVIPEPMEVGVYQMVRVGGYVYPVNVLAFLAAVHSAAGRYAQAA